MVWSVLHWSGLYCKIELHNSNAFSGRTLTHPRMILMVLGLIIVIPVAGLAIFHLGLVCAGRTTNEHVSVTMAMES